jgi:hypothetical protein
VDLFGLSYPLALHEFALNCFEVQVSADYNRSVDS